MRFFFLVFILFCNQLIFCQLQINGTVVELSEKGEQITLADVNIRWLNSTIGTTSDLNGDFKIPYSKDHQKLVFSYIGFITDTIIANRPNLGKILLHREMELEEVVIKNKVNSIQKSLFSAQNVVNVDSREMLKAACCNLSESFETNPSIDVNISDAVSGAKQVQMLGINSPYLLFTQENMPSIRGASQVYGLSFIPGSWIESIQITKGSGSVLNGFESISGQINTELVKPLTDKKFFLNIYGNNYERYEFNTRYNQKINDKIATGLYVHSNLRDGKIDRNKDNFLDTPISKQLNLMNRWQYANLEKGWVSYLNLQYLTDEKQTGQINFNSEDDKFSNTVWGSEINTERFDISAKLGYVFPKLPYQSFGYQTAYSNHNQNSYYGNKIYNIDHESFYSNIIFNSIIGNTQHKFKTGISFTYDNFDELVNTDSYNRIDNSVGTFLEYTYDSLEKLSLVAGIRVDHSNRLETFITPRLHVRYSLWDKASLRMNIGRGKRAANIFAENQQLFASQRSINIMANMGKIYSLKPEIAWNTGVSFTQKAYLFNRLLDFSIDFYHINFTHQVIVDWENPQEISFYNLDGKSYSNSLQIDLNYEILQNFDIRATYKNYDVKIDYDSATLQKPLQPKNRFFINLNYETPIKYEGRQWRMDLTFNKQGKQRLPNTTTNPTPYQLDEFSKPYTIINTQLTRVFSTKFEAYLGGENIANLIQKQPIISANDPFGSYFDSTITFAPVLGEIYYLGIRYKLN
tara:strand:+ start:15020 stop:17260 length:2241 start_codon:yes stop_codon:yes gene_type:complete